MGDQLGHRRLALSQPPDDAQPVHVGHHLVEGAKLAQLFGLSDGRGDGAADPGGRRGQDDHSGWGGASRHINDGLYQSALMLRESRDRCQALSGGAFGFRRRASSAWAGRISSQLASTAYVPTNGRKRSEVNMTSGTASPRIAPERTRSFGASSFRRSALMA